MRPVFVSLEPPCNRACPAGENIQGWLSYAQSGDHERAWRLLTQDNPLPACTGRVCYHPCESRCNRIEIDAAVGIQCVERFLGDEAIRQQWSFTPPSAETGKRILVIGAGPAGLSAACHLRLAGHAVVIREASPKAGGLLRYGIPAYRLPRQRLDAEIARITAMGVVLECNTRVNDIESARRDGRFDAVFLAIGAGLAKRTAIPGAAAANVLDAVSVLRSLEQGEKPRLGRRIVAYGGGNSALDVARSAKRLGAGDPVIVYRRNRAKMPAHDFEVEDALAEGVRVTWLSTITQAGEGTITVEKMELDRNGFPQPTGAFETLDADTVILALGQDVDSSLPRSAGLALRNGAVPVGQDMMTATDGVFAGGDMVAGERTATVAIGHGKKAARHIDAWLRGTRCEAAEPRQPARFDQMNSWYYADAERSEPAMLPMQERQKTFGEVVQGVSEPTAIRESRRCLSCGNCFACDNCYGVCPDNAVTKRGIGLYEFDYDGCKGCGLCAQECPSGAIAMTSD
ncbi:MAG: NAD(P)-binding protein [Alphaproteobacteria bacterium]|nr:NAD(P)-binding protein [Alphaproteobacteria bacterium]